MLKVSPRAFSITTYLLRHLFAPKQNMRQSIYIRTYMTTPPREKVIVSPSYHSEGGKHLKGE